MLALALILALAATSAKGTVAGPTATQANGARVSEGEYTNGWVKSPSPVAGGTAVSFTIVVREQGIDAVKQIALEVSDPDSPRYGRFLSQQQLDEMTGPADADVATVARWLNAHGVRWAMRGASNVEVSATAAQASKLLGTRFHTVHNSAHGQALVRAAGYSIPDDVRPCVAAIFGLIGRPLPPSLPLVVTSTGDASDPALCQGKICVDPNLLATTYHISGVKSTGSRKNRQAVAEFQDQLMSTTDLATLFKEYIKDYKVGVDDTVYAFNGDPEHQGAGVEAELDIQYIMGPAVGIKTEFWEQANTDFCGDLNKWTSNLSSTADIPLVHSVSYGWQGDLRKINCLKSDWTVVDNNFAKLAAKGISMMVSSGDSGSGATGPAPACQPEDFIEAVALVGTVLQTQPAGNAGDCCEVAQGLGAAGWTFVADPSASPAAASRGLRTPAASPAVTDGGPRWPHYGPTCEPDWFPHSTDMECGFHTDGTSTAVLKITDIIYITDGNCNATGGQVTAHNLNGTFANTVVSFGPPTELVPGIWNSRVNATFNGTAYTGTAMLDLKPAPFTSRVKTFDWGAAKWEPGANVPAPSPPGVCTIYNALSGLTKPANASTTSGLKPKPPTPVLWPSWPASSPWVTAVGATRFVMPYDASSPEEMATDQFGSGGGFSTMFNQSPNASWQSAAVTKYLATVDPSSLPPSGSFPALGRATPDVSALGEGYQVIVNGAPVTVGGTSASSPAFASMMSLLNEARLNAGRPPMGFLNPFLYKNAAAFTDVTKGSNNIGRSGEKLPYGYDCAVGWDPATGLGTPRFDKLLAAAMA